MGEEEGENRSAGREMTGPVVGQAELMAAMEEADAQPTADLGDLARVVLLFNGLVTDILATELYSGAVTPDELSRRLNRLRRGAARERGTDSFEATVLAAIHQGLCGTDSTRLAAMRLSVNRSRKRTSRRARAHARRARRR